MEFLWDSLACDCGSLHFVATQEIRWKKGQGTGVKSTGHYVCAKCGENVKLSDLIDRKQREQAEKEIEAIRGSIGQG